MGNHLLGLLVTESLELVKLLAASSAIFFFKVFICQFFYINTLTILHFTQQISKLRTQSRHYPNPIATNGAGVCQYDITNATANYNTVSMTTLGHQFKDKTDNHSNVNAPYVQQKKLAKGGKKPRKVYGPHNCRASTFITENNQCRGAGATGIRYIHVLG